LEIGAGGLAGLEGGLIAIDCLLVAAAVLVAAGHFALGRFTVPLDAQDLIGGGFDRVRFWSGHLYPDLRFGDGRNVPGDGALTLAVDGVGGPGRERGRGKSAQRENAKQASSGHGARPETAVRVAVQLCGFVIHRFTFAGGGLGSPKSSSGSAAAT